MVPYAMVYEMLLLQGSFALISSQNHYNLKQTYPNVGHINFCIIHGLILSLTGIHHLG